jgi:sugar lactone lactonase YvrE
MPMKLLLVSLCGIVMLAFAVTQAQGYVYFADDFGGSIGRADLDGSNVNLDFVTGAGDVEGIAVDGEHIYWTNRSFGTIGRADLDGTNVEQSFITGASVPIGVAVDGQHVYWASSEVFRSIGRANLDGTHLEQEFVQGAGSPLGLAVAGEGLYWSSDNEIRKAGVDGTGIDVVTSEATVPVGVAADGEHVYWASFGSNGSGGTIGRTGLDGTNGDPSFIAGSSSPLGLALAGKHIYWTSSGAGGREIVARANLDGTNVDPHLIGYPGASYVFDSSGPEGGYAALAVDLLGPLAAPVFGRTANLQPVYGVVRIKPLGATGFAPLSSAKTVPLRTTVDTAKGTVKLTTARRARGHRSPAGAHGTTESGLFHGGPFRVTQRMARSHLRGGESVVGFTVLRLAGQPPSGCGRKSAGSAAGVADRGRGGGGRLWGDAHGNFQTGGRYATVTVRGTRWLTEETCAGTRVKVARGVVSVRDLPHHRAILVRAPHSFLAHPGSGG